MLLRNYRSHSRLLELPSRLFYSHSLVASAAREAVQAPAWSELTAPDPHDDAASTHTDLAHAPAKGYLKTLLEELTRSNHGKPGGKADVPVSSGDARQGNIQNDDGPDLETSPGEGHAAIAGSAQGEAANAGLAGESPAGRSTEDDVSGDLHGEESRRGELEALAGKHADGAGEGARIAHGQAEGDEFEEQLPTNTLFYGVAGKQVG